MARTLSGTAIFPTSWSSAASRIWSSSSPSTPEPACQRDGEGRDRARVVAVEAAPAVEDVGVDRRGEHALGRRARVRDRVDERGEPLRGDEADVDEREVEAERVGRVALAPVLGVDRRARTTVVLALVERHVGALLQRVQVVGVVGVERDAGADRDGLGHQAVLRLREAPLEVVCRRRRPRQRSSRASSANSSPPRR